MRILRTIADRLHPYSSTAIKETAERKISCGLISSNDTTDGLAQLVSIALSTEFTGGTLVQYGVDEQWNIEGKRDIIERVGLSHGKFYVTSINETLVSLDVFGSSPEDKAPRPAPVVVEIDGVQYIQFKYPHLRQYRNRSKWR